MSEATGTFHLSHPWLGGPAERTVVQPWLTELSHATLNAYTESAHADVPPALARVEALPVPPASATPRRAAGRHAAPARRLQAAA